MNPVVRRSGRLAVLALFVAAVSGCCVMPWGARGGPRGHGGYHHNNNSGPDHGPQAPAPRRGGRW